MKKKLLLFTDGFPYDPGEKPFVYNEICILSKEYDIDIVAYTRKQFTDMAPCVSLPCNVRSHIYVTKDIGRKDKISLFPKIIVNRCWWDELVEILGGTNCIKQIKESYEYLTRSLIFLSWLKKNIEVGAYDVCYTYWNTYSTLAVAIYKSGHMNTKLITRTHGYDLYNERTPWGHQCYKKYVDKLLDKVVFIAESGKAYYEQHFCSGGREETKYVVNPIGVRKAGNLPTKANDEEKLLVSCSSVIPLKRVELIVEALATINDINIRWIHIGTGNQFEKIKSLCKQKLENQNNICFELKGGMDNIEVRKFYDDNFIDGFITTSSTEGSPVSIQEALAYGIPVIGTDVGEIGSLIEECGYLLPANPEVVEIKNAIESLFGCSKEKELILRNKAYQRWTEKYDSDVNAEAFKEILEALCD